jgi:hypothetical protein
MPKVIITGSRGLIGSESVSHFVEVGYEAIGLENDMRKHAPGATFVFCSTNKVYGDLPNEHPLIELSQRLELPEDQLCQEIAGREFDWSLGEDNRVGDHRWWISDLEPFKRDYPSWDITHDACDILRQIRDRNAKRWVTVA